MCYALVDAKRKTTAEKHYSCFPLCVGGFALVLDKIKSLDKHNKSRMHEQQRNRLLLCLGATRWLTQSKKQQQNSIAIVFRFAVAGIFCLCGAPAPNPGRCFALFNSLPAAPTAQANVRGQQNRAILHNTHALCAMRGQEKAPAPALRINRIMQNVTGFAWPRMF